MPALTIRARSLPYRPPSTVTDRVCTRCGIRFRNHHIKRHGYHTKCTDCRDMD